MTDYALVLSLKYPGSEWSMSNDTYESLTWHSNTPKPTKKQLDALSDEAQAENEQAKLDTIRKAAYQETSDPVFFQWQSGEATKEEWLAAREAVRNSYPSQ